MTAVSVDDRWLKVQTEAYVNKDPAKPYVLNLTALTAGTDEATKTKYSINKKTLLIKSIKMENGFRLGDPNFYPSLDKIGTHATGFTTQNNNATLPQVSSVVNFAGGTVGLDMIENAKKPFYTVSGNQVTLNNLEKGDAISIYTIGGQSISNLVAQSNTATFGLNKGYYLAKIGKETLKLIVY